MRKLFGFSLVEFMIAILVSSIVVIIVVNAYTSLHGNYLYNKTVSGLNDDLHLAMLKIKYDLNRASNFAAFSEHNLNAKYVYLANQDVCNNDVCTLDIANDTRFVGIRSGDAGEFDLIKTGIQSSGTVLKIQYGINPVPYILPIAANSDIINDSSYLQVVTDRKYLPDSCENKSQVPNRFCLDGSSKFALLYGYFDNSINKLNLQAKQYIVSASNRLYLCSNLNPQVSGSLIKVDLSACKDASEQRVISQASNEIYPIINDESASASSYFNYSLTPDASTLQLMNLYTKYYLIGSYQGQTGLYQISVLDDGLTLSQPQLISDVITKLDVKYQVTYLQDMANDGVNRGAHNQMTGLFTSLPAASVNNQSGEARNTQLDYVQILLEAKSKNKVHTFNIGVAVSDYLQQSMIDGVAWRW